MVRLSRAVCLVCALVALGAELAGQTRDSPLRTGFKPPQRLKYVAPEYDGPETLLGVVELLVDPAGQVAAVKVLKGSGPAADAAERAARLWTFEPTHVDGTAVWIAITIPVMRAPRAASEQAASSALKRMYTLRLGTGFEQVDPARVRVTEVRIRNGQPNAADRVVSPSMAAALVPLLGLESADATLAAPASKRVVALVNLAVEGSSGVTTKGFKIYEDGIVQDTNYPSVLYRADGSINLRLTQMR